MLSKTHPSLPSWCPQLHQNYQDQFLTCGYDDSGTGRTFLHKILQRCKSLWKKIKLKVRRFFNFKKKDKRWSECRLSYVGFKSFHLLNTAISMLVLVKIMCNNFIPSHGCVKKFELLCHSARLSCSAFYQLYIELKTKKFVYNTQQCFTFTPCVQFKPKLKCWQHLATWRILTKFN